MGPEDFASPPSARIETVCRLTAVHRRQASGRWYLARNDERVTEREKIPTDGGGKHQFCDGLHSLQKHANSATGSYTGVPFTFLDNQDDMADEIERARDERARKKERLQGE